MDEGLTEAVIWFDPGKTTGLAGLTNATVFESDQLTDLSCLETYLDCWFVHHGVDRLTIGWELYLTTVGGGKSGSPRWAHEAIGAIEQTARQLQRRWDVELATPVPAASRSIITDTILKRLGWYRPGKPHANDAARHLGAYYLRCAGQPPRCLLDVFTNLLEEDIVDPAREAPRGEERP